MKKGILSVILVLFVIQAVVFPQEVYKKKDIAVFGLSYYQWNIPPEVLGRIDEEIRNVFVNLQRFNVIGMNYRLGEVDVNRFIENIKRFKRENVEIPEKVQMGHAFFTKADMNRLMGSFIVVVPYVTYFHVGPTKVNKTYRYRAVINTSFTFINVEDIKTLAVVSIKTEGYDDNPKEAVKDAIEGIPDELTYRIKKIPEFQLKTGIVEVDGWDVIIEFGRDMGVNVGDEYEIVGTRVLKSGKKFNTDKGLLIVKEVNDEVSVAHIIYSKGKVNVGDQVKEIPRFGFDTTPYFHSIIWGNMFIPLIGFRQSMSRGFYRFRPFLGMELPFVVIPYSGLLTNVYIGGEMNLYLGRFQFVPMVGVGVGGIVPLSGDDFYVTHLGGFVDVTLTYLMGRDFKLNLDVGYMEWRGLSVVNYGGVYTGIGLTFKY